MLHLVLYLLLAIVVAVGLFLLASRFLPAGEQIAPPIRDEPVWELPAERTLQPEDVDALRLPVALRGYRFAETDVLLDRLASELRARDAEIARLRGTRDAGAAETVGSEEPAVPDDPASSDEPIALQEPAATDEPIETHGPDESDEPLAGSARDHAPYAPPRPAPTAAGAAPELQPLSEPDGLPVDRPVDGPTSRPGTDDRP